MKVYTDGNNVNILQTVASASTLIGSLSYIAKEYILSKFQKGYFKHVYIDTSESVVQQQRNAAYNDTANKIAYPSMTITPEISLDDPIGAMEKSMHLSSPNLYLRKDAIREYRKLVIDPDNKFSIMYSGDYITTNFNVKIMTDTFINSSDISFYLKSKFQRDFFQYLNGQNIQTEIPKSFIRCIADIKGWNLDNPDDMEAMQLYLIGTGKRPNNILRRKSLSTGKECFFVDDTSNLLMLFTDLDCPSSISRNNQTEGEYMITFRLQISTYLANAFILSIDKTKLRSLNERTIDVMDTDDDQFETGVLTKMSLGLGNILSKKDSIYFTDIEGSEHIGQLIYSNKYTYSVDKPEQTIYLLEELPEEYRKIHSYAVNKLNLDVSSLVSCFVYTSDGVLNKSYYKYNIDTLDLTLYNSFESDFAVAVYVNRILYESIKKAMLEDKDYFSNGFLTNMIANIAGNNVNVNVNKFENSDEFYSSNINKSLRIKTAYGIGYIVLEEDDEYHDSYKICIGFNPDNSPIIKSFKIDK